MSEKELTRIRFKDGRILISCKYLRIMINDINKTKAERIEVLHDTEIIINAYLYILRNAKLLFQTSLVHQ